MSALAIPASTLESDKPLAVLNQTLAERLDLVNGIKRVLAKGGYRIVRQDLRLRGDKRPLLYLDHGDQVLLNKLNNVATTREGDAKRIIGRLHGVDVTWLEGGAA